MKNIAIIILTFISYQLPAQLGLDFESRFVDCEEKWVVLNNSKDSNYTYGLIYIDSKAGLIFNQEGTFRLTPDDKIELKNETKYNVKILLESNKGQAAIIPESLFKDLEIVAIPLWFENHKKNLNTAKKQYELGFMHNGWNECEKAIPFLLKAKELDSDYPGIGVELAFSYNCLKQYDKAIEILEETYSTNTSDEYVNKEIIYSYALKKDINEATKQYYKSIKLIKSDIYNAENCYNILQYYYSINDRVNFKIWYKEMNKWTSENKEMLQSSKLMKDKLKK